MIAMVIVGKIGAPHGIKGWVKIHTYTNPASNLLKYQPWYIKVADEWQTLTVEDKAQHDNKIMAKFANCDDRAQATHYTHALLGVKREQLPKPAAGEHYWVDLMGMRVINQQQVKLGIVKAMTATDAHDILVVKGEQEILIPFITPRYINNVDYDKLVITVDWDLAYQS